MTLRANWVFSDSSKVMAMNEENIIRELKSGNSSILKHVYIHLDSITSFVSNNSGTLEDGHDIFQETLIVFHRNVIKKDFHLSVSIKTYLYAISKRMWMNRLRKNKLDFTSIDSERDQGRIESFEFELPEEASPDLSQQIDLLLDELGGTCKDILQLFYYKKLGLEEIKNQLAYSSSQVVKQQKYRCIKRMREKLMTTTNLSL